MKHADLMVLLADKLENMSKYEYDPTGYDKDILATAGKMPEFQALGFAYSCNDNGPDNESHPKGSWRVTYKGAVSLDAAVKFFDITIHEALHLFDQYAVDRYGNPEPCPFNKKGKSHRVDEPPAWAAGRLKYFARHPDDVKQAS